MQQKVTTPTPELGRRHTEGPTSDSPCSTFVCWHDRRRSFESSQRSAQRFLISESIFPSLKPPADVGSSENCAVCRWKPNISRNIYIIFIILTEHTMFRAVSCDLNNLRPCSQSKYEIYFIYRIKSECNSDHVFSNKRNKSLIVILKIPARLFWSSLEALRQNVILIWGECSEERFYRVGYRNHDAQTSSLRLSARCGLCGARSSFRVPQCVRQRQIKKTNTKITDCCSKWCFKAHSVRQRGF